MRTRRGNLGFGALSSGPISGPHQIAESLPAGAEAGALKIVGAVVVAEVFDPTLGGQVQALKIAGAAIVDPIDTGETTLDKLAGAVVVETRISGGGGGGGGPGDEPFKSIVYKIAGAVVVEGLPRADFPTIPPPAVPRRFRLGNAEYTHTEGLADYLLRGAIPDYGTLRSQLRDGDFIRYRARSGHIEEVAEGQFHWEPNTVTRIRPLFGSALISWGPGRRLLYVTDDYTLPPIGEIVHGNSPLVTGIAEYTHTIGLGSYQLLGPLREWQSFAQALRDRQRVLYRVTNNAFEEFGEGTYDAVNNQLIRGPVGIGSATVNWGPGRKLVYILERY